MARNFISPQPYKNHHKLRTVQYGTVRTQTQNENRVKTYFASQIFASQESSSVSSSPLDWVGSIRLPQEHQPKTSRENIPKIIGPIECDLIVDGSVECIKCEMVLIVGNIHCTFSTQLIIQQTTSNDATIPLISLHGFGNTSQWTVPHSCGTL